ncbi:hypothetical protein AYL99_00450 [Fonsecaea erecta]|uniref:Cytidyltransferase-like domain-containing protein n=1 Tax=Fonsecaea erecta TaxID=1367422 RepID=A0A178ZXB4_9EURO|nr:hypothetical protein AYL99_00450 [Fonsecaea erecta]OAP64478.1 hypothetical protein AYL99_00450 [Fonsecaea erecta]
MATIHPYLSPIFSQPGHADDPACSARFQPSGGLSSLKPLRTDSPNTILMYYGSFNPPHIGHLHLLETVLAYTTDLHVVGTIVWPVPDHRLRNKHPEERGSSQDGPWFSQSQRAQLWRGDPRLPPGVYVVESDMLDDCARSDPGVVFDWIVEAAGYDGYAVQWVDVMGVDRYDDRGSGKDVFKSTGRSFIVSDTRGTKHRDFAQARTLQPAVGCTPWQQIQLPSSEGKIGREDSQTLEGPALQDGQTTPIATVWQCQLMARPTCQARFIAMEGQIRPGTSSTEIRRMLREGPLPQVSDTSSPRLLKDLVLSPDLLLEKMV